MHGIADVGPKLELVVPLDFCPVCNPLELLLTLEQWTIAATDSQAVARTYSRIAERTGIRGRTGYSLIKQESAETRSESILRPGEVRIGNAEAGHGRRARIWLEGIRVVLEISNSEVR